MNEIITKLNDIEEKANGLIEDAKHRKSELELQLEQDKKQLDEKYMHMQQEKEAKLTAELKEAARVQIEKEKEQLAEAKESLEERFSQHQEELAMEVVKRILSE